MNILMIDNFDSFTFNLVDEFEKRNCKVHVYRNNISLENLKSIVKEVKPKLIVISPGPSTPKDAGISIAVIKYYSGKIPIFGVCLGHQAIIEAFYGIVGKAPEVFHGKPSKINHDMKSIYKNLSNPIQVARYHSLCGLKIPNELKVTSKTNNGIVMGVRHKKYFIEGVQFHPESVLTPDGGLMIENLLEELR
ncbi:MAG TPA: aminodeoxychorismate/anthranilate synthase component II [Candidatus Nanoarchaeia archaeon]|nr:aminodeoxychorismate/anthranilate synthase component II [Candidatus Nanoarchaeia archaeon]